MYDHTPSFQSTPVIADGRIPDQRDKLQSWLSFQSTPVIADGRIGHGGPVGHAVKRVSIHARHC